MESQDFMYLLNKYAANEAKYMAAYAEWEEAVDSAMSAGWSGEDIRAEYGEQGEKLGRWKLALDREKSAMVGIHGQIMALFGLDIRVRTLALEMEQTANKPGTANKQSVRAEMRSESLFGWHGREQSKEAMRKKWAIENSEYFDY